MVCYFCLAPYASPFNHARPIPKEKPSALLCDYPDVIKELAYLVYRDEALRTKIFSKLGHSIPETVGVYQRYIGKKRGGTFGAYNVLDTYLDLREEGMA
jgi:hypothetical protein